MEQLQAVSDWAHAFRWETDSDLFGSHAVLPLSAAVVYTVLVSEWGVLKRIGGKEEVRSVAFEIVHNLFLLTLSLSMFIGCLYAAHYRAVVEGEGFVNGLVCSHREPEHLWDGPLGAVTYIFYLSKFYEFVDTFVLALRKKSLLTLHVFHHAMMPIVCYSWFYGAWLEGSWWCTLVNSLIHTMMYSYYLATTLKIQIPGKKYMTQAQIVQFITGIIFVFTFLYMKYAGYGCTGSEKPAIFSTVVNVIFLTMFYNFYKESYKKKKAAKAAEKAQ